MATPRNDNVKEIILNTAGELISKKPMSEISLAEIATAAGISKGTLYYYYRNKTDILFDITDRYLTEQWDDFLKWTENKEKDTSIHRLCKYVIERNIANYNVRFHLLEVAHMGDESIRERLIERYSQFHRLIAGKIAERTDKISADYLTKLMLLVSDGIIIQETLKNDSNGIKEFINESAELLKSFET